MSLISFLLVVVVVVILCWLAIWVIGQAAPNHPKVIDSIIWIVGVIIILLTLTSAMGITPDVRIPKIQ